VRRTITVASLVALALTASIPPAVATCGGAWNLVHAPNPGSSNSTTLFGVAAFSPNRAWAVGTFKDSATGERRTLTERWNGTAWRVVPSPTVGTSFPALLDVDGTRFGDAWAVGQGNGALILHWDGDAWSVVDSPPGGGLTGIDVITEDNAWAVGAVDLVDHWNGVRWRAVTLPPRGESRLHDVAAVSAHDVWAVGSWFDPSSASRDRTLIENWDGASWSVVPSPNAGSGNNQLEEVAVVSEDDVWAVGSFEKETTLHSLVLHWDGSIWTRVRSPSPGASLGAANLLLDVAVLGPSDAWAVGLSSAKVSGLFEHWDGSTWHVVDGASTEPDTGTLSGVTAIPGTDDLWAIGERAQAESSHPLIEMFC
jgi:hypothetical protein